MVSDPKASERLRAQHRRSYDRVLLKISGESFCKPSGFGLETVEVANIARQLGAVTAGGKELAVVVGGGNLLRGSQFAEKGFSRALADQMGMLATIINGIALQDSLERQGIETRLLTAVPVKDFAEPFIRRRAIRHLQKKRVVILAGGTGNPYFTTDTAASLRAKEIGAEVLLKATKVDGVFSADPEKHSDAERFHAMTYLDVLNKKLGVMDLTAISLCMEHGIPIIVFNLKVDGNIERAVRGDDIGTLITA